MITSYFCQKKNTQNKHKIKILILLIIIITKRCKVMYGIQTTIKQYDKKKTNNDKLEEKKLTYKHVNFKNCNIYYECNNFKNL